MCAEKEALRSDICFSSHGLRFSQSLYHAEKDTVKLALQFNCVCLHFILLPVVKFCFSFFQTGELQPRLRTPATEHIRPLRNASVSSPVCGASESPACGVAESPFFKMFSFGGFFGFYRHLFTAYCSAHRIPGYLTHYHHRPERHKKSA